MLSFASIAIVPLLPTTFIDSGSEKIVQVSVSPPSGAGSEQVLERAAEAEAILLADSDVELVATSVPGESDVGFQSVLAAQQGRATNSAQIVVRLDPAVDLDAKIQALAEKLVPVGEDGYKVTVGQQGGAGAMFRRTLPSMSARPVALMVLVLLIVACGGSNEAESASLPPATITVDASASNTAAHETSTPGSRVPDLVGKFDVGGHSLYLECRGKSGPVVLFDAGSGSDGASWSRSRKDFIGLIDNTYRRCVYDRANLGKSDHVAGRRTSATAAEELHSLLHAAGLEPPYVLVGRSFGGYNVRLFAGGYPSEVRALVLVETLTPEFHKGMESLLTPEQWSEESKSFESIEAPLDEIASGPLVAAATLPDVPLLVVAGTKWHLGNEPWPSAWPGPQLDALWDQAQQDLGSSVPSGKTVVFEGGDHSLHFSQPERLAKEINDFLASS